MGYSWLWLVGVTILETALANIATGWLWAGLLFILIFITSLTSAWGGAGEGWCEPRVC